MAGPAGLWQGRAIKPSLNHELTPRRSSLLNTAAVLDVDAKARLSSLFHNNRHMADFPGEGSGNASISAGVQGAAVQNIRYPREEVETTEGINAGTWALVLH
jgi:hypothetical protein